MSGSYVTISDCSRALFASREDTAFLFTEEAEKVTVHDLQPNTDVAKSILQSKYLLGLPCVRGRILMKKKEPNGSVSFLLEHLPSWCRSTGGIWGL